MLKTLASTLLAVALGALGVAAEQGPHEAELRRPRLTVALSGGGARGFAHIGALAAIEDCGLPIDGIVGTSMGAVIGGLYAVGYAPGELAKIVLEADWPRLLQGRAGETRQALGVADAWSLVDLQLDRKGLRLPTGLVDTRALDAFLLRLTLSAASKTTGFDALAVPFRAIATDLETGALVVLDHGPLWRAQRASMAVPGIFPPIEIEGRLLLDGGIADNLPVDEARALGGDLVIAIDVSSPLRKRDELKSFADIIDQTVSFGLRQRRDVAARQADVLVTPTLTGFTGSSLDPSSIRQMIERGREAISPCCSDLRRYFAGVSIDRPARATPSAISLGGITIEGVGGAAAAVVMRELSTIPTDRRVLPDDLAERLLRVRSVASFERVDVALTGAPGETQDLRLTITEVAPLRLRLGLRYDNQTLALARAALTWRHVSNPLHDITLDATLGNVVVLALTARRDHLFARPWSLSATVRHSDTFDELVIDGKNRGQIHDDRSGVHGDLRMALSRSLELTLSCQLERQRSIVAPTFDADSRESTLLAQVRTQLAMDTTDSRVYPTRGGRLTADLAVARRWLGADPSFSRIGLAAEHYAHIGLHSVLYARGVAATRLDGRLPIANELVVGGNDSLPGYSRDEFRGDRLATVNLGVWRDLFALPATMGRAVRFGLQVGAGTVWGGEPERSARGRLKAGVAFRLAAESRLGMFDIALGIGRNWRHTVTMTAGPQF